MDNKIQLAPDERAYIYQQTAALSAYVTPHTEVQFVVELLAQSKRSNADVNADINAVTNAGIYSVQLTAETDAGTMQAVGRSPNFYEATTAARQDLEDQMRALDALTPAPVERDFFVQAAANGTWTRH